MLHGQRLCICATCSATCEFAYFQSLAFHTNAMCTHRVHRCSYPQYTARVAAPSLVGSAARRGAVQPLSTSGAASRVSAGWRGHNSG